MPRATRSIERTSPRTQRQTTLPPGRTRRASHCSLRTPAANVLTLAPASVLSLPSLAGLPQSFTYRTDSTVLLPVAEYLIAQGHGTRREWNAAKQDLTKFVEQSINRLIRSTGLQHRKEYSPSLCAGLTDREDPYGESTLDGSNLRLTIDMGECGWFRMGPITRQLESEAKGLGTAFYAALLDSLWEVGRVYCYGDAEQERDYQIEGIEDENGKGWHDMSPAERSQYEVIDPEAALPKYLKAVKHGGFTEARRKLLAKHTNGPHSILVNHALQLGNLAAQLNKLGPEYHEGDLLPSYLIYIEDHDPITQAFDEWGQHALEGDVTYHWQRTFSPANPEELTKAFESFTLATRIFATASHLTPIVNGAK